MCKEYAAAGCTRLTVSLAPPPGPSMMAANTAVYCTTFDLPPVTTSHEPPLNVSTQCDLQFPANHVPLFSSLQAHSFFGRYICGER
jgi:hypothetical protein